MNQRKMDIMKIRIIQAYAVCKAFLDAYRNEENLKSLEDSEMSLMKYQLLLMPLTILLCSRH